MCRLVGILVSFFPVFLFFLDLVWKVYLDESVSRILVDLFVTVQSLYSRSLKTTEIVRRTTSPKHYIDVRFLRLLDQFLIALFNS